MAKRKSKTGKRSRKPAATSTQRTEPCTHPTVDAAGLVSESARSSDAVADAERFGVDMDQLRDSLKRTPDERLRELDANMDFLTELRDSAFRRNKPA